MRRSILFPLVLVTLLAGLTPAVSRVNAQEAGLCFQETGQCVSGRFRQYWEQNGGLAVFGFPITPAREEVNRDTGKTYVTQWFERNRFELHPENKAPYDVLLGRLGDDRLRQQGRDWQTFPKANASAAHFFAETGHAVAAEFWTYWSSNGLEFDGRRGKTFQESLALFGLPVSEAAVETNASGDTVLTQHFERARFEFHPNKPEPFKVLLGLLGNEVRAGVQAQPSASPSPSPSASPSPSPSASPSPSPSAAPDPCADVPEPKSGRIRPAKCVREGETIFIDIFGFTPNEDIGFWLTDPNGDILGTVQTVNIGPAGGFTGLPLDTDDLEPGLWYFVFQGTTSKHQSIVYFKVLPR